ncbi:DinB family protein [Flexivirga meconopsidis]|uniref:DinB family protein n=1 Tax=Flexivirga meconopsidis TaxID=2977121 RepID=UPI00223EB1D9|nr:DinB family protein [Flexivirga meconopsidis]
MTSTPEDPPAVKSFRDANLRGARFRSCELSEASMRGVIVAGMEVDSPWLFDGDEPFLVNGIDVLPYVGAELDKRFPGRGQRHADTPDGLRDAWAVLQRAWAATAERVAAMPPGTVDVSVDEEWSFAQTLRHLVMATDVWLGRSILGRDPGYHPIGLPYDGYAEDGNDTSYFTTEKPTYDEVLAARADRVGMVTDYLAQVTPEELRIQRANPWAPQYPETTLSCLHTILDEEWEHLRYAERDLDAITRADTSAGERP